MMFRDKFTKAIALACEAFGGDQPNEKLAFITYVDPAYIAQLRDPSFVIDITSYLLAADQQADMREAAEFHAGQITRLVCYLERESLLPENFAVCDIMQGYWPTDVQLPTDVVDRATRTMRFDIAKQLLPGRKSTNAAEVLPGISRPIQGMPEKRWKSAKFRPGYIGE